MRQQRAARASRPVTPRRDPGAPEPEVAHARLLLTVEEAGAAIGVGRSLMYELIARDDIPTVRVGRLRRIRPDDLRAYVASLGA